MRNRPSFAMSAIVVGTYVCALYAARGTPVSARALSPRPAGQTAASRPAAVRAAGLSGNAVADVRTESH